MPCSLIIVYQCYSNCLHAPEVAHSSEMSLNIYRTTWHNNPDDVDCNNYSETEEIIFVIIVCNSDISKE
jgi:hypothetical protein